jgi:ABC-type dipeptide/oligopeptide/nickel transport system permease component
LLVRLAPGYFSNPELLDPRLSSMAATQAAELRAASGNPVMQSLGLDLNLLRGKLGVSRYYQIPVSELLQPRWPVTLRLLGGGLGFAWLAASIALIPSFLNKRAGRNRAERLLLVPAVLLIAVPSGAMAALAVASGYGTPVLVLAAFTAPRVYRFLTVLVQAHLSAEHILFARASGLTLRRILLGHVLPGALPEILALLGTSLVLALGALVPIEVLFDVPGIAQLAFTSALNRDIPVIAATTLVAAGAVAAAAILGDCFSGNRGRMRVTAVEAQ